MKVKTNLALIIDNQRIEAGSTIDIDEATYPSIAAYVTVLEPTAPVAEVTEDKPKRKRA